MSRNTGRIGALVAWTLLRRGAAKGTPPLWVGLRALLPLALLESTGLYLLVLPWLRGQRSG